MSRYPPAHHATSTQNDLFRPVVLGLRYRNTRLSWGRECSGNVSLWFVGVYLISDHLSVLNTSPLRPDFVFILSHSAAEAREIRSRVDSAVETGSE